ncbi:TPA: hypothetical protein EYP13_02730 [Candidatus Micrarchaeota archaeon]|nr:hypothetical protein [Candidatus Micrarchaeota archaeon]
MIQSKKRRTQQALRFAQCFQHRLYEPTIPVNLEGIRSRLRAHQIVLEEEGVLVTDSGFVTMAILPQYAYAVRGMIAIPGRDDQGNSGYLVIRQYLPPYHSFELQPFAAIIEAEEATLKSERLIAEFGSKAEMVKAVKNAPHWMLITESDFVRSGLCYWGVKSTLSRLGVLDYAHRRGIPCFLVSALTGAYGVRLIASALLRHRAMLSVKSAEAA